MVLAQPSSSWQLLREASCKSVFKTESFLIGIHVISITTDTAWGRHSPDVNVISEPLTNTLGNGVGSSLLFQAQKQPWSPTYNPWSQPQQNSSWLDAVAQMATARKLESSVFSVLFHLPTILHFQWSVTGNLLFSDQLSFLNYSETASTKALRISILR